MTVENMQADTFPKLLLRHAAERGARPVFREKTRGIWRTTSWSDLADEASAIAAALSVRGLQRGTHVAFLGENRPRLYVAMCAAHWLGAVAVPLYQDSTAEELAALIKSGEVAYVFAENQEQVDKVLQILPQCPSIRCIVHDKDRGMRHYKQPQLVAYAELLREGRALAESKRESLRAEAARGKGQDAAFLFFTSGATGPAKGVVLTHASLIDRARVAAAAADLKDTDVAMAYLSPGWIGQNLFSYVQPMAVGYCVCCPESSETMLSDMREMGPSYFLATPRVLEALLTQVSLRVQDAGGINQRLYRRSMAVAQRIGARTLAGETVSLGDRVASKMYDVLIRGPLRDVLGLSKVRVAYTAGDVIAPDLLMFFRALGVNLKQLYGSTETGFFVATQRDGTIRPETVGTAADGVELKISPEREILVRSPGLFSEYYRDPQATAQAKTADGWYRTGDAGHLDDNGDLRVIDRIKYVGALKDGTAYTPRLLENKLKFTPYIKEAVVFGDGRETVCALIDIDPVAVGRWADKQTISYTGHADLASRDEVYGLIAGVISDINAGLARDPALAKAQIHRFLLLPKELDADDGALTRTGKLRRDVVAERYKALIEAMYSGAQNVRLGAEFGAAGGEFVDIRIRDVRAAGSAPMGRAA